MAYLLSWQVTKFIVYPFVYNIVPVAYCRPFWPGDGRTLRGWRFDSSSGRGCESHPYNFLPGGAMYATSCEKRRMANRLRHIQATWWGNAINCITKCPWRRPGRCLSPLHLYDNRTRVVKVCRASKACFLWDWQHSISFSLKKGNWWSFTSL